MLLTGPSEALLIDGGFTYPDGQALADAIKATGKTLTAHFAHLYQLRNGRIIRMQQYVDSALVQRALD
ncbi:nuclear transport factor 2 family protein [Pseudomonas sp. EpS/L25]|uniref:nuclear transport factor 2 family protein n=1 Tax=Pseudomonas sp. EpS/L25 TaxID=1749078 RepID=UPI00074452A0|nr:hypothetical protein [Pseudomonas sp. EpS/L25]KUM44831.1 hypothetical protein AR540_00015 [Pseudomonas sp. EpS/L25]